MRPRPTLIAQPIEDMTRTAIAALLEQMATGSRAEASHPVSAEADRARVVRASCATLKGMRPFVSWPRITFLPDGQYKFLLLRIVSSRAEHRGPRRATGMMRCASVNSRRRRFCRVARSQSGMPLIGETFVELGGEIGAHDLQKLGAEFRPDLGELSHLLQIPGGDPGGPAHHHVHGLTRPLYALTFPMS